MSDAAPRYQRRRRRRLPARPAGAADRLSRRPHALRGAAAGLRAAAARGRRGRGRARAGRRARAAGRARRSRCSRAAATRSACAWSASSGRSRTRAASPTTRDAPLLAAEPRLQPRDGDPPDRRRGPGARSRAGCARSAPRPRRVRGATTSNAGFLGILAAVLRGVGLAIGLVCLTRWSRRSRSPRASAAARVALLRAAGADRATVGARAGGRRARGRGARRARRGRARAGGARAAGRLARRRLRLARARADAGAGRCWSSAGVLALAAIATAVIVAARRCASRSSPGCGRSDAAAPPLILAALLAAGCGSTAEPARRRARRSTPRSSTATATACSSAARASRCATARSWRGGGRRGRDARHLRADHRRARARRGVARARAVPRPARRRSQPDLPPPGGADRAGPRRRGAVAQPPAPAGRARHRRPRRQRAGQRARAARGGRSTAGGCDPTPARPATAACRRPTTPTRFYYRPDVDPPRHPGCSPRAQRAVHRPRPRRARGTRCSATTTCSPRARCRPRRRIEALATGDRALVESLDPRLRPAPGTDSEARRPRVRARPALLAGGDPRRASPADPARRLLGPAETSCGGSAAAGATAAGSTTGSTSAPSVRGIVLDVVNRGGRGARRRDAGAGRVAARRAAPRPAAATSSSSPTSRSSASDGGEAALRALDAAPRVVAAIAGHRHRNAIAPPPPRPLLAGRDRVAGRLPPAGAHLPARPTAGGARARDLDGRPRRAGSRRDLAGSPRARVPRRPGRPAAGLAGGRRTATPASGCRRGAEGPDR